MLTKLLPSIWKVSIAPLSVAQMPINPRQRTLVKAVRILNVVWVIPCSRPFIAARRLGKV